MNEVNKQTEIAAWLMSRAMEIYHDKAGFSYPDIIGMLMRVYMPETTLLRPNPTVKEGGAA